MKNGIKRSVFLHYWRAGPLTGILVGAALWNVAEDRGTLAISITAAILSVAFFVQQQKLAEMQMLKQLIVEFNQRYDKLNDVLQVVVKGGIQSDHERRAIIDYFNLCAEEHLFYDQGYIDERVWESWRNGMKFYFSSFPIRELWGAEAATNSYYGFNTPSVANEESATTALHPREHTRGHEHRLFSPISMN